MRKEILLVLLIIMFIVGCVSNKQVQYLQYGDVNGKKLLKDSVVRVYDISKYEYKIQPNDILSIDFESLTQKEFDFLGEEKMNNNQIGGNNVGAIINGELVDPLGEIEFPVIGKIKVSGLTIFEIQDTLQSIGNQFLKEAVVKVRLLNFRFTVLGEVTKEGTVNSYNNRISILEGISLSGGIDDLADRSNVKIIRQTDGGVEIQYINLLDEELIRSPYYYIHQNDVIIVPPLKQRPFRKYAAQNLSLILSSTSMILLVISLL